MPITYAKSSGLSDGVDRLLQAETRLGDRGDVLAEVDAPPKPAPRPHLFAAMESTARTGWMAGVVGAAYRPGGADPDFNPIEHIRSRPDLLDDPVVIAAAERGQFDETRTYEQFEYDLNQARVFFADLDRLGRASTRVRLSAGLAVGAADPLNLVPVARGARILAGGVTIPRVLEAAATGGAFGLADKVLSNQTLPISNEPDTITDEVAAVGTTAALSAMIGFVTSPVVPNVRGLLPTRRLQHLVREAEQVAAADSPSPTIDYSAAKYTPPKPAVAEATSEPVRFTKAEIEDKLIGAHRDLVGSFERSTDADFDRDIADGSFTFYQKLPGEVRDIIASHPETRRLFKVTDKPGQAGGEDYAQSIGWEAFTREAVSLGGADLRQAVEFFRGSEQFPEQAFLAALYETLPKGGLRGKVESVDPSSLPVGAEFSIMGERFEVVDLGSDEFSYKVLRDGDVFPDTPAQALESIPVDKGSLSKPGEAAATPDYPPREVSEIRVAMGAAARGEFDTPLEAEFDAGRVFLERVLAEDPVERTVVALNQPGDINADLLAQIELKYRAAGVPLHVEPHPAQREFEMLTMARQIAADQNLAAEATPEDLGSGGGPVAGFARFLGKATPGGRLADAPMAAIQRVLRTLSGSAATVTRGQARDPLGYRAAPGAESLKDVYDGWRDQSLIGIAKTWADARRAGPVTFNGSEITTRAEFDRAVHDLLRNRAAAADGFEPAPLFDVHASVERAADQVADYLRRVGQEAHAAGLLDEFDPSRPYLPRVYDVAVVRSNETQFKRALVSGFEAASLRNGEGGRLDPQLRPLIPELVERLDADRLREIMQAKAERMRAESNLPGMADATDAPAVGLVEGDLPDVMFEQYDRAREAFWASNAETAFRRIITPERSHGAEATVKPFAARSLQVDETEIAPFLVADLQDLLGRYGYGVHGDVAVRRAIALNPDWRNVKLADGSMVQTGEQLIRHVHEQLDAVDFVARRENRKRGLADSDPGSLTEQVKALRARVDSDLAVPLAMIEGRSPFGSDAAGVYGSMRYLGRNAMRVSYMSKLGSVAVAQITDLAPLVLHFMTHPKDLRFIPAAIRGFRGLPAEDLRALNLGLAGILRERAINGVDDLVAGRGFGTGRTRRNTARFERGLERTSDAFTRATLLPWITDVEHRLAGTLVLSKLTPAAQKFARAAWLVKGGSSLDAALKEVGMSRYDAARLNKLGLNRQTAAKYLDLVYEHGLTESDVPIRTVMSKADFIDGRAMPDGGLVKPNFGEWSVDDPAAVALRDTLAANLRSEVARSLIVQPGAFDRPLINQTVIGRIFNQFQGFVLAFANQRMRVVGQLPWSRQLPHVMAYLMLGAMSDAVSQALSGRRSLDETAKLWTDNPMGATYNAVSRSGMLGWLDRPIGIADALKLPLSPSRVLGAQPSSTAARHVDPAQALTLFGPVASDTARAVGVVADLASGRADRRTAYNAAKLLPGSNLFWLRLLHRGTGLPVVPEAMVD